MVRRIYTSSTQQFKRADLRRRHRRVPQSRNRHRDLHPVMQGTAGFFSTVNTRETNWILTEQERRNKEVKWGKSISSKKMKSTSHTKGFFKQ